MSSISHFEEKNKPIDSNTPHRVSVAEVLIRISNETQRMSLNSAKLEDEIERILSNSSTAVSTNLQGIDILCQELAGLSHFLKALVDTLDEHGGCLPKKAALVLKMEQQANRLCNNLDRSADENSRDTVLWTSIEDSESLRS
jgi:ABC-type transporter Mla subunit MlaD